MMKKMDKKAFTLIELLVVIAVVGILVLLAAPRFTGYTQKAEDARIQHDIKVMEQEVGTMLINGDDDFNEWENNINDLNQLAQDDELFEKEGRVAKNGDPINGTYKVIPKEYKGKINTKLKGTFYANSAGKVYYEHGQGPGYSDEELDDLFENHDFIPIATADELNNVRDDETNLFGKGTKWEDEYTGGLDKKYVQVANINLSVYSEEGWDPIGTRSGEFTGTYDGGNYVIKDLEVKGAGNDYQGLFGYTEGATISNVGLIDNKVTGKGHIGGLVGAAYQSTMISNSYATGSVTGTSDYVGGLVGLAQAGTEINNSYTTGSVTGTNWSYVGGLVGMAYTDIEINNSYATGSVKGAGSFVGGLVGYAYFSTNITDSYATGKVETSADYAGGLVGGTWESTINNSYSIGSVTGPGRYVGGLVGMASRSSTIENSYATGSATSTNTRGSSTGTYEVGGLVGAVENSTISNSYATGSATGTNATGSVTGKYKIGGLVGVVENSTISNSYATGEVNGLGESFAGGLVGVVENSTITNSHWDKETTGQSTSAGGGEGKLTDDMKKQTTYTDWDFDTVWEITPGNYPTLR